MNIRQQDAAAPHAVKSNLKLISVSAIALMVGIGVAVAQSGGDARKTERHIEKQKDDQLLSPVRPLPRKVGDTSWPEPKPEAQKEANERKNAPPPRETTGQAAKSEPAPQQQPAQNNAPAPQQNNTAQNQPAQNQPAPQNNTAQTQQPAPQNNTAQNQPAQNNAPAQPNQQANQQSQPNQDGHASIRLGTDAGGKVAINDDQERQLTTALRKSRISPVELNVAVRVGGPAPQDVRLAAVSSDIVQVLPQFRGYSYFATANEVYIVDAAANRVVAFFPVKLTATASRTPRGGASDAMAAQPADTTASVSPDDPNSRKSRRAARRANELAGIEAAVEQEMSRRGIVIRGGGQSRTVVVEEEPVQTYRVRRPWFLGGRSIEP